MYTRVLSACPLLGGLSSCGVSFIGGFPVHYDLEEKTTLAGLKWGGVTVKTPKIKAHSSSTKLYCSVKDKMASPKESFIRSHMSTLASLCGVLIVISQKAGVSNSTCLLAYPP